MNNSPKKTLKEDFAKFFESPTREGLRDLLKNNLGEFPHCDFKAEWPDPTSLSKHTLGLANFGGGCIIVGVSEKEDKSLDAVGLDSLTDKNDIISKIKHYLPASLLNELDILDFSFPDSEYKNIVGLSFQVLIVPTDYTKLPFISLKSGKSINVSTIYTRRGTSTESVNHQELQEIINKRISTGYSSETELNLESHLQQLKTLYKQISPYNVITRQGPLQSFVKSMTQGLIGLGEYEEKEKNPHYPSESYEQFISTLITKKKVLIELEIQVHKFNN